MTGPTTSTTATRRSCWRRPRREKWLGADFSGCPRLGKIGSTLLPTVHRSRSTRHGPAAFVNRHKERERRHNRGHRYPGRIPRVCIPLDTTTRTPMRSSKISFRRLGRRAARAGRRRAGAQRDRDFQRHRERRGQLPGIGDRHGLRRVRRVSERRLPRRRSASAARTARRIRSLSTSARAAARSPPGSSRDGARHGLLAYNLYRDAARTEIWGDGVAASTFTVGGTGTAGGNALASHCVWRLPSAGNENAPWAATRSTSRSPSRTDGVPCAA